MYELKRVIFSKLNILSALLLVILNIIFAVYTCSDVKQITETGETLASYEERYESFLNGTGKSAKTLLSMAIFSSEDSYVRKNIEKTAEDYAKLEGITVTPGENRAVVLFSTFELPGILLLVYIVFLVVAFTAEKRSGLTGLVRSTAGGRARLSFKRLGILTGAVFVMSALLSAGSLAVFSVCYPGTLWNSPIQSVPEFMKCPFVLTVSEYAAVATLQRAAAALVLGLILYVLLKFTGTGLAGTLFGAAIALEYLFYKLIVPTSVLCGFRYINLYQMLLKRDCFTEYNNVNVFGHPVALLKYLFALAGMLCALLGATVILGDSTAVCARNGRLSRLADRVREFADRHKPCGHRFTWEIRKVMFDQGGIIILAVVVYLAVSASNGADYKDMRSSYERYWYDYFAGELTGERIGEIHSTYDKETTRLERMLRNRERLLTQIARVAEAGGNTDSLWSSYSTLEYKIEIKNLEVNGLEAVMQQVQTEEEWMKEHDIVLELVEPYSYTLLLEHDYRTTGQNRLYIAIAIICALSGIMAFEYKAGMEMQLKTLLKGRRAVTRNKILIALAVSVLTSLGIHMIQFVQIGRAYGYEHLGAPAQCIPCIAGFPLPVSIRGYLIILYAARCLAAAGAGLATMAVGRLTKDRVLTLTVCVFTMIVPLVILNVG